LPHLENLYIGGFGVTDGALVGLGGSESLTQLTFGSLSRFTSIGISEFIAKLGEGNNGMVLSIESADPDYAIIEEEQTVLRDLIEVKVDGRFEYQLLRGKAARLVYQKTR
jgi:hypothetical protein